MEFLPRDMAGVSPGVEPTCETESSLSVSSSLMASLIVVSTILSRRLRPDGLALIKFALPPLAAASPPLKLTLGDARSVVSVAEEGVHSVELCSSIVSISDAFLGVADDLFASACLLA